MSGSSSQQSQLEWGESGGRWSADVVDAKSNSGKGDGVHFEFLILTACLISKFIPILLLLTLSFFFQKKAIWHVKS